MNLFCFFWGHRRQRVPYGRALVTVVTGSYVPVRLEQCTRCKKVFVA